MSGATRTHKAIASEAIAQVRDALATLCYASDGHFEDEAQEALDALDWIERELLPKRERPPP